MPESNSLDVLRDRVNALLERAPMMDADDWAVEALPLLFDVSAALADVAALVEAARDLLADDDMPNHWDDCVCSYCTRNRALRAALAPFRLPADRKEQP